MKKRNFWKFFQGFESTVEFKRAWAKSSASKSTGQEGVLSLFMEKQGKFFLSCCEVYLKKFNVSTSQAVIVGLCFTLKV